MAHSFGVHVHVNNRIYCFSLSFYIVIHSGEKPTPLRRLSPFSLFSDITVLYFTRHSTVQYKVLDIARSFCMSNSDQHNGHVKEIHVNVVKVRNILSDESFFVN